MSHWIEKSIFYHIYPLGCFGAPKKNDFTSPVVPRIQELEQWISHLKKMHFNALYLGPVFESSSHGYDTVNYYQVDHRLGDNQTLASLIELYHKNGIRIIFDAVFNHVGRDFFAFRDLQTHREKSIYRDWFSGIDFNSHSPFNDPFHYDGWNDHYDLVKLNLSNPVVINYFLETVSYWIDFFHIDGIRIDAADCIEVLFLQKLNKHCKQRDPDFWLMGEVIHGDYSQWVNCGALDSVTNYESYKGLYSSHNDHNYFEIAYSLNRQFGADGIYNQFLPYSFADNHDVNRLTSTLSDPAHIFPLYCLLFSMPGVPSIYYGSEWGISGARTPTEDTALRPRIKLENVTMNTVYQSLPEYIARLSEIRLHSPALQYGKYQQIYVANEQFAFLRQSTEETMLCVFNASSQSIQLDINELPIADANGEDLITNEQFHIKQSMLSIPILHPSSGLIIHLDA
ncbi:MAG TPA: alpha-amylase [Anaerolineaceae bacterium]|nr:alpha-amylase [Anaerolineaceae bacterium]